MEEGEDCKKEESEEEEDEEMSDNDTWIKVNTCQWFCFKVVLMGDGHGGERRLR